jgi:uncharacterized membrane protein YdjX (TVP38/TMEM64 family)
MNKQRFRQFLTIIIALAVPIIPFAIIGELPGERWLSANDSNALLFALTACAILAADILLPLPSSIIGTFIGARLGLLPGFFVILLGLTVGHIIGFLLGRLAFRKVESTFSEVPTLIVVFLSRPVPVLAEAVAIAAGAGAMPFRHYLGVCLPGNAIYAAVLAGNGATLLPDALLGPGLVIPMLLPVLTWSIWRWIASPKP